MKVESIIYSSKFFRNNCITTRELHPHWNRAKSPYEHLTVKVKRKGSGTCYSANMSQTRDQKRFPISEVMAADRHELIWYRSVFCGHKFPALTNNWTRDRVASRHTTAPISHIIGRDGHGSGRPAGRVGSKFLKCMISSADRLHRHGAETAGF